MAGILGGGWRGAAAAVALALAACASAPVQPPSPPTHALAAATTASTPLGRSAGHVLASLAVAPGASALHLLDDGARALQVRRQLIDRAERSLDLQYYIWRPDESGRALAAALWQAAERGVRVRLLLDDWGARPSEEALGRLAAHPNIDVRLFNPIVLRWSRALALLMDFDGTNRRMHNKLLIADNQAIVIGGRNIGDEYFGRSAALQLGDLDVLAVGRVVGEASNGFDRYWNHADVLRVAAGERPAAPPAPPAPTRSEATSAPRQDFAADGVKWFAGRATALQDEPRKSDPAHEVGPLGRRIAGLAGDVRSDVLLVSPYFVPGPGGVAQLRALRERGVRVRIVTNSLAATDVPAVHAGYGRYRRDLLAAGVELFEIRPDPVLPRRAASLGSIGSSRVSLHAKVLVIDGRVSFVGSMNIDPRSQRLNTENGLVIESVELARTLVAGVDGALDDRAYRLELVDDRLQWVWRDAQGRTVVESQEPLAGVWLRLQVRVLGWLPIEDLL